MPSTHRSQNSLWISRAKTSALTLIAGLLFTSASLLAVPFDPDQWPTVADTNKVVHYVSVDNFLPPLSVGWVPSLTILSGGDQDTSPITLRSRAGLKAVGNNLNTSDSGFTEWADNDNIDILVQVYGDAAVLGGTGQPRNFTFLIGTLPELSFPVGGQIPVEGKNLKWNWVLFRITNGVRASDGSRFVGSIPANAQGAFQSGGVNGGTIRLEGVPNLIVRAVAFGERGAFGEPSDYTFQPPDACDPEPATNLAFLDLQNTNSSHMTVLNGGDQVTEIVTNAGPVGNKRRAVRALGTLMNFGVEDNFLGKPCNDPRAVKICVEFYDDPALTGVRFGPEAYATDSTGSVGVYPSARWYTLTGSGEWKHVAWTIPSVSLFGVNVTPLTGGPRLGFEGGQPFISRFDLGILRVTPNPLAGQDPLPNCFEDPDICTTNYGNYAEMNLATGVLNGLAPGTSGGDQNMIQAEAGPATDLRMAIRPALDDGTPGFTHQYLNLAIENQPFGPTSQPNARLAIVMTYYDDPALAGKTFRPEVYKSDRNGTETFAFTAGNIAVALKGTGKWLEAYFELPDVKFSGVNQGPQAAARFFVSGKIFFSRVRYAVIRPCGPYAGVNLLAQSQPPVFRVQQEGNNLRLSWQAALTGWVLQKTDSLSPLNWTTVPGSPVVEGNDQTVRTPITGTAYYRLIRTNNETP
ncbi:MAG: hypothetical protein ABIQ35_00375 [Verrucomicrobiota bacterium]